MPPPATITRITLILPNTPAPPFVILHAGKQLVTNSIPQEFSSTAEAEAHLERVIGLRKKEGYKIKSTETIAPGDLANAAAGTDEVLRAGDRITLRFREKATAAGCAALVRGLAKDAPRFLQLLCDPATPGTHWEKAVADQPLPSVKAFVFDTPSQTQVRQAENSLGDLPATLAALPSLERLFANGKLALSACLHGKLKALHLLGDPLPAPCLKGLARCEFPELERLVLSLASDAGPISGKEALAALAGLRAPRLREFHLECLEDAGATLAALLKKGIPASLKVLGLSGSLDEDQLLATLRAHAPRLSQLEALALPLGDEISSGGDEEARKLLPNLRDSAESARLTLPEVYAGW